MKLSRIDRLGGLILLVATSVSAEEPTCRWLQLDDTKVYQCAVLPKQELPRAVPVDQLPDPTLPLAEQSYADPGPSVGERIVEPVVERKVQPKIEPKPLPVAEGEQFIVLGLGDIESNKARLLAGGDREFAYLPSINGLSLGVFSKQSNAVRRQKTVERFGVASIVKPHKQKSQQHVKQIVRSYPNDFASVSRSSTNSEPEKIQGLVKVSNISANDKAKRKKSGAQGYIVASVGDSERVIEKLERMNERDFVLLTRGPYANRVSVGVFSNLDNAIARQEFFKRLGIDSEVVERNEERVVSSTKESAKQAPKIDHYDQIALIPLDI